MACSTSATRCKIENVNQIIIKFLTRTTMKREIKFRYRYTNGKQWIFQDFTLGDIINGDPFEVISDNPMYKDWRMDGADEFTGVKDKLGAEIYEGAIVKLYEKNQYGVMDIFTKEVVFLDGCFCLKDYVNAMDSLHTTYPYVEVIGNIYQNAKLLVNRI